MPGSNPILRHWQTELEIFKKNFSLLQQKLNEDAIHDLRVAIKKLRSYFKLYLALSKKEDKGQLLKTKALFSVLGRHRNLEITRQLSLSFAPKNSQKIKPLLVYLQLLQDQVAEYCLQAIQQYDIGELNKLTIQMIKEFENFEEHELHQETKNVIGSSIENVKDNLEDFHEKSHLVRKDLKNCFYWSKIFEEHLVFSKTEVKRMDHILDKLGNIQDHEVLITNLKNFRKAILSDAMKEYDMIKKMEGKAEKKKDDLLEKANELTQELIASIK
ncbi:MAG TPA: CHAD domain-containing protein [Chitinophagaceae bacterium]